MNIGIVGASGYSGEVLLSLLLDHPRITLKTVTSRKLMGETVESVFPSLRNRGKGLTFSVSDPEQLASDEALDLVFLALPHGIASEFAIPLCEAGKKVIDLSADFRLNSEETYKDYYGSPHPNPTWLARSGYVIPEITPDGWQDLQLIAAPGCYPTSILTPLLPLVKDRVIGTKGIVINSMSGVSGAGKKLAEDYLYCERNESAKAYGLVRHRHLSEIEEQLSLFAGNKVVVQFTPHLAPMNRGIATTIVIPSAENCLDRVYQSWNDIYQNRPFVSVLNPGQTPDTKFVVHTNRVDFSATYDPRTKNLIITSAEDNLMKGAAGQAVQIMNLWHGFEETAGLL
ncbi:MAG: N-acetyl-gamma-glutamyl-phosphate reductase [Verrucomicrobiae bacterium]|nr:N-acetyl-gamma-glutamyl-phosphate reductase [Verrucomicrobiae bacterium]